MSCMSDQEEPKEVGVAQWSWLTLPIAGCAFLAELGNAVEGLCGNLTVAMCAHLNYKRMDADTEVLEGPVFKSE